MSARIIPFPRRVPPHVPVIIALSEANAASLYLITNGKEIVQSPVVLPGWRRVGVFVKPIRPTVSAPGASDATTEVRA